MFFSGFHFANLHNFSLVENVFPLMYYLYIRKCQSYRNVKDCRWPGRPSGWGKKKKKNTTSRCYPGLCYLSCGRRGWCGIGEQSNNTETFSAFFFRQCHYNSLHTIQQVGLLLWLLSDFSKRFLVPPVGTSRLLVLQAFRLEKDCWQWKGWRRQALWRTWSYGTLALFLFNKSLKTSPWYDQTCLYVKHIYNILLHIYIQTELHNYFNIY